MTVIVDTQLSLHIAIKQFISAFNPTISKITALGNSVKRMQIKPGKFP
jgi:hypothetical protein